MGTIKTTPKTQPLRRTDQVKRSPPPKKPSAQALPTPSVGELTAAFDELVAALMEHRRRPRPLPEKIECYSLGQLMETPEEVLVAIDLVRDPIGYALRRGGLKKLAKLLAAVLKMDDLQRLVERHGEIDPRRISMLDHVFDGSTSKDGALWIA